jgi:hypothetical protein
VLFAFSCVSLAQSPTCILKGTVTGQDSKAIHVVNVQLAGTGISTKEQRNVSVPVTADGRFSCSLSSPGFYRLQLSGIGHYDVEVPLLVRKEVAGIDLSVSLRPYDFVDSLTDVRLIGDFNKFSFTQGAVPMTRMPDGRFHATVRADGDSLAYQVVGIEKTGRSINGTQQDATRYDGNGDYLSILPSCP